MTSRLRDHDGSAFLEMAVGASMFLMLVFALIEFGRFMLTYNTTSEATRLGARLAATCTAGSTDTAAHQRIRDKLAFWAKAGGYAIPAAATNSWLTFSYFDASGAACTTAATCQTVQVATSGLSANLLIPGIPLTIALPAFPVRVVRETMNASPNGTANPACP
ncbi:MAG: pilus assembly protein [Betaproteobacteria bacterium]|nr:pilus assembly protein [Betaproteobacteria bacterium]